MVVDKLHPAVVRESLLHIRTLADGRVKDVELHVVGRKLARQTSDESHHGAEQEARVVQGWRTDSTLVSNMTLSKEDIMHVLVSCGNQWSAIYTDTDDDTIQAGSIIKKRRRKMNHHKYRKWRKKMKSIYRHLGKI